MNSSPRRRRPRTRYFGVDTKTMVVAMKRKKNGAKTCPQKYSVRKSCTKSNHIDIYTYICKYQKTTKNDTGKTMNKKEQKCHNTESTFYVSLLPERVRRVLHRIVYKMRSKDERMKRMREDFSLDEIGEKEACTSCVCENDRRTAPARDDGNDRDPLFGIGIVGLCSPKKRYRRQRRQRGLVLRRNTQQEKRATTRSEIHTPGNPHSRSTEHS
ncbi:uncharacterized protein LOC143210044 [Lasioglossum baleicum]|uniref:uncharacterized protein LOC143210044 n=1 Tax=Lasioglossum baleicum TaxID=434251 RepID=UPI003FCD1B64